MHYRICHITPVACSLINFYMTDIVIKPSHYWILYPFLVYYNLIYFIYIKVTGIIPYWFVDWKDYKTPVFCVLCGMLLIAVYFLVSGATYLIKGRK